ncbi:MAG TPA: helix-turn-helix domain-containing protein [Streptosporangiaceae bacterium]|jgi:DNA-binding CsgD family transcriptional regulator
MSVLLGMAGLTPAEEAVYLALLDLPPVTAGEACQACAGVNRTEVPAILASLTGKGLVTHLPQRPLRYKPVAPQAALEGLLGQREEELRRARAALAGLSERYQAVPRQAGSDEVAEIVTGKSATLRRWFTSWSSARCQIRLLGRPPFGTGSSVFTLCTREALRTGTPVRAVYDESALRDPQAIALRRARIAAGEQARMAGEVPMPLMLVDDALALLPLVPGRPRSDGLLVVRSCALLEALSVLFELVWGNALPLGLDATPGPAAQPEVLGNDTTRAILALLSAGLGDQAIARRLGCSERTVQRHVLKLAEAVGAKTRFQAALHIGHRGWTS